MIRLLHLLLCILLAASFILIFCEFLIYYFVAIHCSWPELIPHGNGEAQRLEETQYVEPLHVMFLSDTHLLGTRHGHWFDKLRRYTLIPLTLDPERLIRFISDSAMWIND